MIWQHRKCFCRNKNRKKTLADLEAGSVVTVTDLCKDRSFRNRIVSLGIQVGSKIEVLKKAYSEKGCMIIRVGGSRLIINSGLAEKIKVTTDKQS
jgi:Fe2+ transport system protein FeoA